MQAKRRDADAQEVKDMQRFDKENYNGAYATPDYAGYKDLNPEEWEEKTHSPGFSRIFGKKKQERTGGGKAKPQNIINEAPPLLQDEGPALEDNLINNEAPGSKFADDYALLNSQQGSDEERKLAYNNILRTPRTT